MLTAQRGGYARQRRDKSDPRQPRFGIEPSEEGPAGRNQQCQSDTYGNRDPKQSGDFALRDATSLNDRLTSTEIDEHERESGNREDHTDQAIVLWRQETGQAHDNTNLEDAVDHARDHRNRAAARGQPSMSRL